MEDACKPVMLGSTSEIPEASGEIICDKLLADLLCL